MRIAVFYPDQILASWSLSRGLADTFRHMGHDVLDCGIVPSPSQPFRHDKYPRFEQLNHVDRIIVSAPEHMRWYIRALYPEWDQVKPKVVGWMHETVRREDYGILPLEEIRRFCHCLLTPAYQDQEYGLEWLPFGVDTRLFNGDVDGPREHGPTFIGWLYRKRQEALKRWDIPLRVGNFGVKGPDGAILHSDSARAYVAELRNTKVFVNLPTLCDHLVLKVLEALSCGCLVVTPITTSGAAMPNYQVFRHGIHLLYYQDEPRDCLRMAEDEAFRRSVAREGQSEVLEKHALHLRCQRMLEV
jgi:hypothetical protein